MNREMGSLADACVEYFVLWGMLLAFKTERAVPWQRKRGRKHRPLFMMPELRCYILAIIASPNLEQVTSLASGIKRAKS
jgi:hypothetical protein